ncbi:chemotaxis protein [Gilvimarinus polysaccharolyticus]|uniref:chemotaxis protein n=1 Tax=Gilvimarinus polysaccharolyticus TaxID=863921 RepID=UPI0006739856|nr:chemotaxis protein [Gilvimarinus polysaccharolyticus]
MSTISQSMSQGLLLFWLTPTQRFALGTFKVKEIVPFTPVRPMPESAPAVLGAANIRGGTLPIVDLAAAMGGPGLNAEEQRSGFIIVTDCQRKRVGFLVRKLDRIVQTQGKDVEPPPRHLGRKTYLTGVIRVDDALVQLVDIERIFANFEDAQSSVLEDDLTAQAAALKSLNILVVDDSSVARKQLGDALKTLGVEFRMTDDGREALDIMQTDARNGRPVDLLVSDIEMPGLDGYELSFAVRDDPALAGAYLILHSSISSEISVSQAHQVGANEALTKFDVNELITAMLRAVK